MKKTIIAVLLTLATFGVKAQNTFPTTGNVGIGTTAPKTDLQVIGIARAGISTTEYTEVSHGGGNGYINTVGDGNLDFRHDGANKMSLTSNGFLGIGNAIPKTKLHVSGAIIAGGRTDAIFNNTTNGTELSGYEGILLPGPTSQYNISVQDGNGRIQHKWNATTGTNEKFLVGNEDASFIDWTGVADNSNWIEFKFADGAGKKAGDAISWQTHLSITDKGQIGIGTATPQANLQVMGIARAGISTTEYTEVSHGGENGYINTVGDGNLDFRHDGTNKMSLTSNGFLGLGTSAPQTNLQVIGIARAGISTTEYTEVSHGGGNGYINTVGDGNLDFRHDGANKMSLTSNGFLGIGNATPKTKLHVSGAIIAGGRTDAIFNNTANGTTLSGYEGIILPGPTSQYNISVQDGNGRIQHKWNATTGTNEKFLVGNEDASFIDWTGVADNSNWIEFKFADGAGKKAGDAISWQTHLSITDKGQIGIGTATPQANLQVMGIARAGISTTEYTEVSHGGENGYINTVGDGNLDFRHDGANKMSLTSNGFLGIGNATPKTKLHVSGAIIAGGRTDAIFNNTTNGTELSGYEGILLPGPTSQYNISVQDGNGRIQHKWNATTGTSEKFLVDNEDASFIDWTGVANNSNWIEFKFANGDGKKAGDAIRWQTHLSISDKGQVGIGSGASNLGSYKLAVEGAIGAREIEVKQGNWADFVFEDDYELKDLNEVESFINENKHLPDVPSEKEVTENGINLGQMDAILLQKIEELTLYMIEVKKENESLKAEIEELKKQ